MSNHLFNNPTKGSPDNWGILAKLDNTVFLEEQSRLHNTAMYLGKTECQRCGFCCLKRPCVPMPDELPTIAEYLGITAKQLAKEYCVVGIRNSIPYLLFAWETQKDLLGKLLPWYRTWDRGYCIMFDKENRACKIYPVRPLSAKLLQCWVGRSQNSINPADPWTREEVEKLLPNINLEED